LGVPVVPMAARRGAGVKELLGAIEMVASGQFSASPHRIKYIDEKLETAIETLAEQLRVEFDDLPNARWVALRLLEGDENIINAVENRTLGRVKEAGAFPSLVESEAR
jgi:ferrous iron transport protein B